MEWQPINTAPTDGNEILLWVKWTGPVIGHFGSRGWIVSREGLEADGGWNGATIVHQNGIEFTAWAPLPTPNKQLCI